MSDGAGDEDVVQLGQADRGGLGQRLLGERFRLPEGWRPASGWRPPRGACVLAATALVVGLAAGFAAGRGGGILPERVAVRPAPVRPSATASPSLGPATTFPYLDSLALDQDIGACSVQSGRQLALGVEVTNRSMVPVTLESAKAVLPLGGLTQVSWDWTTCGALPQALAGQVVDILLPGASTWLTMTFTVKLACPAPLPVQFTIGYLAAGRSATASLPGFPDLSQVPYTGCPRNSAASTGAQFVQATGP